MSFLTAQPDELAAAAGKLLTVGGQQAAQNAAAAAPTTGVIPAAADEVSALQASLFTAYGTLYQQVSAQAAAMYDTFVNTLGLSAGTYSATELVNSSAAGSPFSAAVGVPSALTDTPINDIANLVDIGAGNWASALSNLIGMANGGLVVPLDDSATAAADAAASAGTAGLTAAPVSTGISGASLVAAPIGTLSAPAAWAGPATLTSSGGTASGTSWAAAAPQAAAQTTILPGMPGISTSGRSSAGFGAPRYGVKPIVMSQASS